MARPKKAFADKSGVGKAITFRWLKKLLKKVNRASFDAAIKITQGVKAFLNSPVGGLLVDVIPGDLDNRIVEIIKPQLTKILAAELLIHDLPADPTEEEIKAVVPKILNAFGYIPENRRGKFYSNVAAEIAVFVEAHNGNEVGIGEALALIKELYEEWKNIEEQEKIDEMRRKLAAAKKPRK
jgi:hypothetical protein